MKNYPVITKNIQPVIIKQIQQVIHKEIQPLINTQIQQLSPISQRKTTKKYSIYSTSNNY